MNYGSVDIDLTPPPANPKDGSLMVVTSRKFSRSAVELMFNHKTWNVVRPPGDMGAGAILGEQEDMVRLTLWLAMPTDELSFLESRAAELAGRPVDIEKTKDGQFVALWLRFETPPPPKGKSKEEALRLFVQMLLNLNEKEDSLVGG